MQQVDVFTSMLSAVSVTPVMVAIGVTVWFMINCLIFFLLAEYQGRISFMSSRWFNPVRVLSRDNYTEIGKEYRRK